MAKHGTYKRTTNGKRETLARKSKRALKYATADFDTILSGLDRPLAVAR